MLRSTFSFRVYAHSFWGTDRFLGQTPGELSVPVDAPWYVKPTDCDLPTSFLPELLEGLRQGAIEGLSLAGCRGLDAAAWPLLRTARLTLLDAFNTRLDDDGVRELHEPSALRSLNLAGTSITDRSLEWLARMPALESLHLGWCAITDRGLASLAESRSLKNLDLRNTQVTDRGMTLVARMPALAGLGLEETQVGDAGLAALRPAASRLEHFDLGYTKVSDGSLPTLRELEAVRTLVLRGTAIDRAHDDALVRARQAGAFRLVR